MRNQSIVNLIQDANDRLGDCRGAVEMVVQAMLESPDAEQTQSNAVGALTLAVKEIKRIQEELDEASSKGGRAQARNLLSPVGAEVDHG